MESPPARQSFRLNSLLNKVPPVPATLLDLFIVDRLQADDRVGSLGQLQEFLDGYRAARALVLHEMPGHASKFLVDAWHQRPQRFRISLYPGAKQFGGFGTFGTQENCDSS